MKMENYKELPLQELFYRLRKAGLPLGIVEYQLLIKALQAGYGIDNKEALSDLCCTLWVKSDTDKELFDYHFQAVMTEDEIDFSPPAKLNIVISKELDNSPDEKRKISLPLRYLFVFGGLLFSFLLFFLSLIFKPECPYIISKPPEYINKKIEFKYRIEVCKASPQDKFIIKPLRLHPALKFKDTNPVDEKATISGKFNKDESLGYTSINIWDTVNKELLSINDKISNSKSHSDTKVIFGPNNQYLASANVGERARLWDLKGNLITSFDNADNIKHIEFSPNGQYVITINSEKKAKLWDLKGNQITNFDNIDDIKQIDFSPNSQYFVTIDSEEKAKLWNLSGNQITNFNNADNIKQIKFSPNGNYLASANYGARARVWDLEGNLITSLDKSFIIQELNFSPNSQYLVSIDSSKNAKLWNLTGNQITNFDNVDNILKIEFSPNNQYFVTIDSETKAKLWDFNGNQIAKLVPMFELSRQGLDMAIEILRGKSQNLSQDEVMNL